MYHKRVKEQILQLVDLCRIFEEVFFSIPVFVCQVV